MNSLGVTTKKKHTLWPGLIIARACHEIAGPSEWGRFLLLFEKLGHCQSKPGKFMFENIFFSNPDCNFLYCLWGKYHNLHECLHCFLLFQIFNVFNQARQSTDGVIYCMQHLPTSQCGFRLGKKGRVGMSQPHAEISKTLN